MSGKLTYLALILLLIGVACLVVGEVNLSNVKTVEVGEQYSVWSYASDLTEGRTYGVDIASGDDWGKPFASEGQQAMPVNVTITSPEGGVTTLQAFYYGLPTSSPYYHVGTPPTIVEVLYESVDGAGMAVDSSSPHIRFAARQSGPYNVTVLQDGLWSTLPPDYIMFYEEVSPNSETYSLLASGGGVVGVVGGVFLVVGLFRGKGAKRKKTRK